MAIAKREAFTEEEQAIAKLAKSISHPARIAILKFLAAQKDCVCGEIVEFLPLAQSTVSQHLKELKNAGFIKGSIEGPKSCYCINYATVNKIQNHFNQIFKQIQLDPTGTCCNHSK